MAKGRTYNLACPIDRTGIAANLLANRLSALTADNLVNKKDGKHGTKLYQLTELGRKTSDLLFELAKLGTQFEPKGDVSSRENIRAIAVILGTACKLALAPHQDLVATFNVDDEQLTLIVKFGSVNVYSHTVLSPDLELDTNNEAILKFLETKMTFEYFAAEHCKITVHTIGKEYEFMALMMAAQSHLQG
ncbi:hypothetical protein DL239_20515 [Sedimentitalea sp. CY04]|uniref:HTH hxlR-type domain-containing protein n=1 Tax=Parasedimentitalea denitrificans TaxID=2211118 RepID=A0ABX0WCB7_9RHOB|nr:winged helix-turn-helix transcriptional regulator [Sedimentitalea sp. CY04]NIZ63354.1 hypothetical protein [Sedimentitalea sp. CY04]